MSSEILVSFKELRASESLCKGNKKYLKLVALNVHTNFYVKKTIYIKSKLFNQGRGANKHGGEFS